MDCQVSFSVFESLTDSDGTSEMVASSHTFTWQSIILHQTTYMCIEHRLEKLAWKRCFTGGKWCCGSLCVCVLPEVRSSSQFEGEAGKVHYTVWDQEENRHDRSYGIQLAQEQSCLKYYTAKLYQQWDIMHAVCIPELRRTDSHCVGHYIIY